MKNVLIVTGIQVVGSLAGMAVLSGQTPTIQLVGALAISLATTYFALSVIK